MGEKWHCFVFRIPWHGISSENLEKVEFGEKWNALLSRHAGGSQERVYDPLWSLQNFTQYLGSRCIPWKSKTGSMILPDLTIKVWTGSRIPNDLLARVSLDLGSHWTLWYKLSGKCVYCRMEHLRCLLSKAFQWLPKQKYFYFCMWLV